MSWLFINVRNISQHAIKCYLYIMRLKPTL